MGIDACFEVFSGKNVRYNYLQFSYFVLFSHFFVMFSPLLEYLLEYLLEGVLWERIWTLGVASGSRGGLLAPLRGLTVYVAESASRLSRRKERFVKYSV